MAENSSSERPNLLIRSLDAWGGVWNNTFELIGGVSYLVRDVAGWLGKGLFTRRVRIGHTAVITQMVRVGVRSVGIVMLVCASVGFILALQMEPPLADFGQQDKIANIVGVAVFRELGPLIAAIVLTGFAGASIAAELGTMVVGEEIEALEAMALNPVRFLVLPRVLATLIMMVLLTIIADVMIALGGWLTARLVLGPQAYIGFLHNMRVQLRYTDFITGLIQAAVFGVLISLIACRQGLDVRGGAEGVGKATTHTVVHSIVAIVLAAGAFTSIFYVFDI